MRELSIYYFISSIMLHFLAALRSDAMMLGSDSSGCTVPNNFVCWNISLSTGFYSQFGGVLASVIFLAITVLLIPTTQQILNDPPRKKARDITLYSLYVTFFSLLTSSFLFAELAGEQTTIRAFAAGCIVSSLFVLSVLQVMLSINWLFQGHDVDISILNLGWWLFQAVSFIAWLDMILLFENLISIRTANDLENLWNYIGIGLVILIYCLSFGAAYRLSKKVAPEKFYPLILRFSVILIVVACIIYGIVGNIPEAMISRAPIGFFILGSAILLFLIILPFFFCYQLSLPYTPSRNSKQPSQQEGAEQIVSLQSINVDQRQAQNVTAQLHPPSPEKSTHRSLRGFAVIGIIIAIGWLISVNTKYSFKNNFRSRSKGQ